MVNEQVGKGDKYRPMTDRETYERNYKSISPSDCESCMRDCQVNYIRKCPDYTRMNVKGGTDGSVS